MHTSNVKTICYELAYYVSAIAGHLAFITQGSTHPRIALAMMQNDLQEINHRMRNLGASIEAADEQIANAASIAVGGDALATYELLEKRLIAVEVRFNAEVERIYVRLQELEATGSQEEAGV